MYQMNPMQWLCLLNLFNLIMILIMTKIFWSKSFNYPLPIKKKFLMK